ncbi:hypothetical protein [Pelodictyon luteolum]|nr:hypothetical protein [Pelodictyon luteolum]
MKPSRSLRMVLAALFLLPLLGGCQGKPSSTLDADDVRFSEFYSEYLLTSGVSEDTGGAITADLDSATLASMLERHSLSMEKLKAKSDLYRTDPERWQKVLVRVRENIRKKADAPK